MNEAILALAGEVGGHPTLALIIGAILAAFLRGRYASMVMVLAPVIGLGFVSTLEPGTQSVVSLFGQDIVLTAVDKQAKLFGYLFHLAALIAGIYSFHLRDPLQVSMGLLYAATAVGVALPGHDFRLSLVGGFASLPSSDQMRTKQAESWLPIPFLPYLLGPAFAGGILFRYHGEGKQRLPDALDQALESGRRALLFCSPLESRPLFPFTGWDGKRGHRYRLVRSAPSQPQSTLARLFLGRS